LGTVTIKANLEKSKNYKEFQRLQTHQRPLPYALVNSSSMHQKYRTTHWVFKKEAEFKKILQYPDDLTYLEEADFHGEVGDYLDEDEKSNLEVQAQTTLDGRPCLVMKM
jgi:hypothetical protein